MKLNKPLVGIIFFLLTFCGPPPEESAAGFEEDESLGSIRAGKQPDRATNQIASNPEGRTVPVTLEFVDGISGLSLAAVDAFSIDIDSCASGYTVSGITAASVNLYEGDQGCLAKLTEFEMNLVTYDTQTTALDTWAANDEGVFTDGGVNSYYVAVIAQLSATIGGDGAETVTYEVYPIDAGSDETLTQDLTQSDSHNLEVNEWPAPNFVIDTVTYNGMDVNGSGEFVFRMECEQNESSGSCYEHDMDDHIEYILLKDGDENASAGVVTYAEAVAIWADGSLTKTTVAAGDLLAAGAGSPNDTTNARGGFDTTSSGLSGPIDMHLNKNMLLILRSKKAASPLGSFRYFNVDVTAVSQ